MDPAPVAPKPFVCVSLHPCTFASCWKRTPRPFEVPSSPTPPAVPFTLCSQRSPSEPTATLAPVSAPDEHARHHPADFGESAARPHTSLAPTPAHASSPSPFSAPLADAPCHLPCPHSDIPQPQPHSCPDTVPMGTAQGVRYVPPVPTVPMPSQTAPVVFLDYPDDQYQNDLPIKLLIAPSHHAPTFLR